MTKNRIPSATYRLQLNRDFTLDEAAELIPYLQRIGISHVYLSPILKARAGSVHGYDIVEHNEINPEIGDEASLARFVERLHAHEMGLILDIVPNHMGVFGNDNAWWLDVLEQGPASIYADHFDIDWNPIKPELHGKLLIPVLGDHYGRVLENGDLMLRFEPETAEFSIHYFGHRFPIDPRTYPSVLEYRLDQLAETIGETAPELLELKTLISSFSHLPTRYELAAERLDERRRDQLVHKKHLGELHQNSVAVRQFIEQNLTELNGTVGDPSSFDRLHFVLEQQAYRLAYWQVASDEINYRRFFDINDLAGIRVEQGDVFETTHRLLLRLLSERRLDGLRIDHPDGLYDPLAYYRRLCGEVRRTLPDTPREDPDIAVSPYVVVEKILAGYEHLPLEWPVHGTTGYEVCTLLGGLFVAPEAERPLDTIYTRFTGVHHDFDAILYERKKLTIRLQLSSELNVLANSLSQIAERNRHTRDFTLNGCRDALIEIAACFPVYRTYITEKQVSDEDRKYVEWAIAQAKKGCSAGDVSIFEFIRRLLLDDVSDPDAGHRGRAANFAMRLQQFTAPVMAKALEDTVFYLYNRLVMLNEVGGDPRRFGTSLAAFHRANVERHRFWPESMVSTSTHDSKRSEDVRARIAVITEIPRDWHKHLARWARLNRGGKTLLESGPAPSRNDEYLLYQTLLGTWPLDEPSPAEFQSYAARIRAYMLKAVKEAKVNTSWVNPNPEYELALIRFIDLLLGNRRKAFRRDFVPFQQRVARFGLLNALSQTLLRMTIPGVPDTYQGMEEWNFSLVDPDNRRLVDYNRLQRRVESLETRWAAADNRQALTRQLARDLEDGMAKLHIICRTLAHRRRLPELYLQGDYLPLSVQGDQADHVCAFARRHDQDVVVVIAPRFLVSLLGGVEAPRERPDWGTNRLELPSGFATPLTDLLTGRTHRIAESGNDPPTLPLAEVLSDFPVSLLTNRPL